MFVQAHVAGSDMAGTPDTCQTVSRRFRFRAGPATHPPSPAGFARSRPPAPRPRRGTRPQPSIGRFPNPAGFLSVFAATSPIVLASLSFSFSLPPSNQKKCQERKGERKKEIIGKGWRKGKERLISFRSRLSELNALDGCFLAEIQC